MQNKLTLLIACCFLLINIACNQKNTKIIKDKSDMAYKVELELKETNITNFSDFHTIATIYNNGQKPLEINQYTISIFALEIQDLAGQSLPKYPPPVPDDAQFEGGKEVLKVGAKKSIPLKRLNVSNVYKVKSGKYKVRFNTIGIIIDGTNEEEIPLKSDWYTITVQNSSN